MRLPDVPVPRPARARRPVVDGDFGRVWREETGTMIGMWTGLKETGGSGNMVSLMLEPAPTQDARG